MMCFGGGGQTQYVPAPTAAASTTQSDKERRDALNRIDEGKKITQQIADSPPVVLGASRGASQVMT